MPNWEDDGRDPEASFLWRLEGCPTVAHRPSTINPLLRKKGYLRGMGAMTPFSQDPGPAWDRWTQECPRGRAWWSKPDALTVPSKWPHRLADVLPAPVTPREWVVNVLPRDSGATRGMRVWRPTGTPELAVTAFGFPITDREMDRAVAAVGDLMSSPHFVIWAYNLDLSYIPLPMDRRWSLEEKLTARKRLEEAPLSWGEDVARKALPESLLREPWKLLLACPRNGQKPSQSTKGSWRSVFSPKNLDRLRREGRKAPLEAPEGT